MCAIVTTGDTRESLELHVKKQEAEDSHLYLVRTGEFKFCSELGVQGQGRPKLALSTCF